MRIESDGGGYSVMIEFDSVIMANDPGTFARCRPYSVVANDSRVTADEFVGLGSGM